LQGAAEQTEQNIVLIQCGWFGTPSEEEHFKASLARDCTNIRIISIDSRISENRYRCWAAADFFISLSDNIQESFGLTPVEAMASGLPAVVTDWDGYKETVRDGTDGFRIPTWMPPADSGGLLAEAYEAGVDPYAVYVGLVAQSVSLDLHLLVERLTALIVNPELRRRMGEAGRNRAQTVFDWKLIYQRYEDLWEELAGIRRFAAKESNRESLIQRAPRFAPSRMDPFRLFRHYSSSSIKPMTTVSVCPSARSLDFARFVEHPIFAWAQKALPPVKLANYLLRTIEPEESIASICHRTGIRVAVLTRTLSVLAKMGLVRLCPGGQSPRNES
jgi:hypothetical protein